MAKRFKIYENFVDTYEIATMGQNLSNTFTLASNGILIEILIEDIGGATVPGIKRKKEEEKELDRKKITVIVTIDQVEYKETKIVEGMPTLKASDVKVGVDTTKKTPKITINI